jgi:2-octaprenyl-6-methoxyphenol hydroxylase
VQYDIIIVGGGLVGKSLAIALRDLNIRIALLESKPQHLPDARLFALNFSSCQLLNHIGVLPKLIDNEAEIRQVHISHQGHFGALRLNNTDVDLPYLGQVIPADQLEQALDYALTQISHIDIYQPAQLLELASHNESVDLKIKANDNEIHCSAKWVIGADGTHSTVRREIKSDEEIIDYQQTAIVTRIQLQRSHHNTAYERFCRDGAIAILPLAEKECACIWSLDRDRALEWLSLSDQAYLDLLQKEFGYRLGRLHSTSSRHSYPLQMVKAKNTVSKRIILLGNAAHTVHPIAAQGLNLALYETAQLAEHIIDCVTQQSIAALSLDQINLQTQKQRQFSLLLSHHLSTLFSNKSIIPNFLLQSGLLGLELASPIKTKLIEAIIGQQGRVPRLLNKLNESIYGT